MSGLYDKDSRLIGQLTNGFNPGLITVCILYTSFDQLILGFHNWYFKAKSANATNGSYCMNAAQESCFSGQTTAWFTVDLWLCIYQYNPRVHVINSYIYIELIKINWLIEEICHWKSRRRQKRTKVILKLRVLATDWIWGGGEPTGQDWENIMREETNPDDPTHLPSGDRQPSNLSSIITRNTIFTRMDPTITITTKKQHRLLAIIIIIIWPSQRVLIFYLHQQNQSTDGRVV